ncbi:hypothetical protein AAFF_G00201030 [Aldrovandia affinis]|uniref:Uncharacterized protein n=1 Tax=Aldrovandia affinis TaxID=143900 RepID=A0AAD7W5V4_9TELE|nr:hypothetical protein AAFF_G00201030 [Aldrovandia affinis]
MSHVGLARLWCGQELPDLPVEVRNRKPVFDMRDTRLTATQCQGRCSRPKPTELAEPSPWATRAAHRRRTLAVKTSEITFNRADSEADVQPAHAIKGAAAAPAPAIRSLKVNAGPGRAHSRAVLLGSRGRLWSLYTACCAFIPNIDSPLRLAVQLRPPPSQRK